jgi:hypothetical protein
MKAFHPDTRGAATPQLCEIKPQSFIYAIPRALAPDLCRDMIRRFEASKDQQYQGRIGRQQRQQTSIKRSTDLRISGRSDWKDIDRALFDSLSSALNQISGLHPYFAANPFKGVGYNMQRTQLGEYYHWHVDAGPGQFSQRQLVAIWYLNDVEGLGGETEFLLQQLTVKPEQGKLILFPPFWTHVHRGVTLQNGEKYIATTWVCFAADQSSSDG